MGFSQKLADVRSEPAVQPKRRTFFSAVRQKFWKDSSKITTEAKEEMYDRNGIGGNVIDLIAGKTFNKWWDPNIEDEQLTKEIDLLNRNKELCFKKNITEGFKWSKVFGWSLAILSYVDGAAGVEDEVVNPIDITKITIVDERHVRNFIWENETQKSGELLGVKLKGNMVGLGSDLIVHRSRFIVIGDLQSRGLLHRAWNWLELFDNNSWSFGQTMFRYGSGFPFLKINEADDEEIEEAEAMWQNVTSRTGFVGDHRYDLKFVGAEGRALPLKDAHEIGMQLVSIAMKVEYALVVGAHAGAVTGSETNSRELYDKIEAIQQNEAEPIVWEFLEKFAEVGLLHTVEFRIVWEPLWQLSAMEQAEVNLKNAQTDDIYFKHGALNPDEVRRIREFRVLEPDSDFDRPDGEGSTYVPVGNTGGGGGSFGQVFSPLNVNSPGQDAAVSLSTEEKTFILDQTNKVLDAFAEKQSGKLLDLYDFEKMKVTVDELQQKDSVKDANTQQFLEKIDVVVDSNLESANEFAEEFVNDAFVLGTDRSQIELKTTVPLAFVFGSPSRVTLRSQLFDAVKGLNADVKRDLRNTLLDALQKNDGTSLVDVRNALKDRLDKLKIQLPDSRINTITRTESSRAFHEAKDQAYASVGVPSTTWLTARDNKVRPDHARNDGVTVARGKSFPSGHVRPPIDPNCRCTVVPSFQVIGA